MKKSFLAAMGTADFKSKIPNPAQASKIQAGVTLIELLLAIFLMSLVSVALSQTFAVGTDAYLRGRKAVRSLGDARAAARTLVDAVRSASMTSDRIELERKAEGSAFHLLRWSRAGLEENGFFPSKASGSNQIHFRREWPAADELSKGGAAFPVARQASAFQVRMVREDGRSIDRWPSLSSAADTPPRLVRFTFRQPDGAIFESASYARVDPESLTAVSDTATDT